jgi:hypothetical protein
MQKEILAIQLTENLHRRDLSAVDEANAYLKYFLGRHPDKNLDGVINTIITFARDQNRVENEFAATVAVNRQSNRISYTSVRNMLSLLKIPEEIQAAFKTGQIGVSQGYIFADNLSSPALMRIFNDILDKPRTNSALKMAFVAVAQTGQPAPDAPSAAADTQAS